MIFLTLENGRLGAEVDGMVVEVAEAAGVLGCEGLPHTLLELVTAPEGTAAPTKPRA